MQIQLKDKGVLEFVGKVMLRADSEAFPRYKVLLKPTQTTSSQLVNYSQTHFPHRGHDITCFNKICTFFFCFCEKKGGSQDELLYILQVHYGNFFVGSHISNSNFGQSHSCALSFVYLYSKAFGSFSVNIYGNLIILLFQVAFKFPIKFLLL